MLPSSCLFYRTEKIFLFVKRRLADIDMVEYNFRQLKQTVELIFESVC